MSEPKRSPVALPGVSHANDASIHVAHAAMHVYIRFEVWDLVHMNFVALPAMPVDMMYDDSPIETVRTDANGSIHWLLYKHGNNTESLYFRAHSKGTPVGGIALPDEWSTKKWKDKNGKPGFFPKAPFVWTVDKDGMLTGGSFGGASETYPLVYRIGLDFHVRLQYVHPEDEAAGKGPRRGPKGVHIGIAPPDRIVAKGWQRTDVHGECHGLVFDVDAGDDVFFQIPFVIDDPDINLPPAIATMTPEPPPAWETRDSDGDQVLFPNNSSTSIGTQDNPVKITCRFDDRNVRMFFLTTLYEHACFFFHITNGASTGVQGLQIRANIPAEWLAEKAGARAHSFPVGVVNIIPSSEWWNRSTIIHELSHQVMWKEAGISTADIASWFATSLYSRDHYESLLTNDLTALLEGWAETFEELFEPGSLRFHSPYNVTVDGESWAPLNEFSPNSGEAVEGAFALGLVGVMQNFTGSGSKGVPLSFNGNVLPGAPWIVVPDVQKRFKSAIWDPLHKMGPAPLTRSFLAAMKKSSPDDWSKILPELNKFNMAMEPAIVSVAPNSGSVDGGQPISIFGANFVPSHTKVTIGGKEAQLDPMPKGVISQLNCKTPVGSVGKADVVVTTAIGSATLKQGYEYINLASTDPLP